MMRRILLAAFGSLVLGFGVSPVTAADSVPVAGAGATFPQPLYLKWAEAYRRATGVVVTYRGTGSGDGVKQIEAGTVAFGATDRPLAQGELALNHLRQFPTLVGGIVPIVNLDGIDPGALVLNGSVLSQIYRGAIRRWDDPAIVALNPTVALPAQPITVVHRSDSSGTTFVFTSYLAAVDPDWRSAGGVGTSVTWPVGQAAAGNDGIAALVGQTGGAIGYVDYAIAKSNTLAYPVLVNKEGRIVQPTPAAFGAAVAARGAWTPRDGSAFDLVDQPGSASWPIVSATYILVRQDEKATTRAALQFFSWGLARGGSIVEDLDYVPLSPRVVSGILAEFVY